MRHTPRPFIREFKNQSLRSSAVRLPKVDEADASSKQPFLNSDLFAASAFHHQDGYQAALKEADAIFGKSNVQTQPEAPPSIVPHGRVLPSLIGIEDAKTPQQADADKQVRENGGAAKLKQASRIKAKRVLQPASEATGSTIQKQATSTPRETPSPSRSRRERSSIQKRWVFETEPGPGQKWKKRKPAG